MALLDRMDPKESVELMAQSEALDPKDPRDPLETEENKDWLDLVESLDWEDLADPRVMSEIREKMVNWVWLALLVPLVTKVPVDHPVSPARLVLMVSLELLVSLAVLERRDL